MKMKNFLFCAMAFIAALAFSTACMDDLSQNYEIVDGAKVIPYTVEVQNAPETKVTIDGRKNMLFEEGDKLVVTGTDIHGELLLIKGANTSYGTFSGNLYYEGAGTPSPELELTATLVGIKSVDVSTLGYGNAIGSSLTDAFEKYSLLQGTTTFEQKWFGLQQKSSFVEFSITFDPAPTDGEQTVVIKGDEGATTFCTGTVSFVDGLAQFAAAFPGETVINKGSIQILSQDFHFGGASSTLAAGKFYRVAKAFVRDRAIPFTMQALGAGTFTIANPQTFTISYVKNGGEKVDSNANPIEIDVAANDVVEFYADNSVYGIPIWGEIEDQTIFGSDVDFYAYGNLMSLNTSTNFATQKEFGGTFCYLFYNNTHLFNHPEHDLVLPAETVGSGAYTYMFSGCSNLTKAPALPASSLKSTIWVYAGMFRNCTSLTTAPVLPATLIDQSCYREMFKGCTSLVSAPELPATNFDSPSAAGYHCYESMFEGCTSLTAGPSVLPATYLYTSDNSYQKMFKGCTSLTTAPELPATSIGEYCYASMFEGCTSLATPPVLPASTVQNHGYWMMFKGCTNLATAPDLPATSIGYNAYANMFEGCTSLTKAPDLLDPDPGSDAYYEMFKDCSNLSYIKCLLNYSDPSYSTRNWVEGVASTGTFVKNPAMSHWELNSVDGIPVGWTVKDDGADNPLTMQAVEAGTITITNPFDLTIMYSIDGGDRTSDSSNPISIPVAAGQTVKLYGNNANYGGYSGDSYKATVITSDIDCYVYGNVMSLLDADNFGSMTTITSSYTFYGLFEGNAHLLNHPKEDILLPATVIGPGVYSWDTYLAMFKDCTGLTRAPVLPATDLSRTVDCYAHMFEGCTGLVTPPALPAEVLGNSCYYRMFKGSGITSMPILPATTLVKDCYNGMFYGCTSLTSVRTLPATTLAESCYAGMFEGCTKISRAPALPAETLAEGCYSGMFDGCSNLTTAPALPAMSIPMTAYGRMFKDCIKLRTAPEIPATVVGYASCMSMFEGCTSLKTAPSVLAAEEVKNMTYEYMFKGCTALTKSPIIKAKFIDFAGCEEMFSGCSNLNYVTCMAVDRYGSAPGTENWLKDVAATGTFVKAAEMNTWPMDSPSGVPVGWTIAGYDDPLTLEAMASGTITVSNPLHLPIIYSKNGGEASTSSSDISISGLVAGDRVSFWGNSTSYGYIDVADNNEIVNTNIRSDMDCYVYGNVMSLIDEDDYTSLETLTGDYAFLGLFLENTHLFSHPDYELRLPATMLTKGCYGAMFGGCTSLDRAPALPAEDMQESCYAGMFSGCTGLTSAPRLPAKNLADSCYMSMFYGSGLTSSPALPASTLSEKCYAYMFSHCENLTSAGAIAAIRSGATGVLAKNCCMGMYEYSGVKYASSKSSTSPLYEFSSDNVLAEGCFSGMFRGCTSISSISMGSLPDMAPRCFEEMFKGCTKIKSAITLNTTTAEACYRSMFEDCTSLTGNSGGIQTDVLAAHSCERMFYGCSSLAKVKCLATDISATDCVKDWLYGVADVGTFTKASATTWPEGASGIPSGWGVNAE